MVSSTPITSGWPSGTNVFSSKPSRILEPVRPDHAPRDKNRWNRLNPLSDVPSTARSAAHTVRRFRHSRAPVASATAFSHDGCVNIPANGSSQISIARALPASPLCAMARSPHEVISSSERGWGRGIASASSPLALPRCFPHLLSQWQPATSLVNATVAADDPGRDPDPIPAPTSDQQGTPPGCPGHHRPGRLLDWAKRLGLTQGRTVVLGSEHDMTLVEDLATYLPRPGRSHPLDRYARTARFAPDSDEAIVLEAMRHARFSLWRVERRHETAGLILQDLLHGGDIWLVDETMEKSAPRGVEMAARLLQSESFAMTARIIVPVTSNLMEEVFTRAPALQRTQGDTLARDPRFAIGLYRAAVLTGAMGSVRFKR